MNHNVASFLRTLFIVILILACLFFGAGALAVDRLPRMAAEKFGPPSPRLTLRQKLIYSFRLLANEGALLTPRDPQGQPRPFQIELGESVNSIAFNLEEAGIIANADTFRTYLVYTGLDTDIQAGQYLLSPAMTVVQVAQELRDPVPENVQFNILPGWRAEEIAASLPTSGIQVTPENFLQVVYNPPGEIFPENIPQVDSLEGYMLPGEYQVKRDISAQELAEMFIGRFDELTGDDLRQRYSQHGLTLSEAVILASIVQREAVVADEQPVIASVFYNRLGNGMRLESDPTVQYGLGYDEAAKSWWKNPLTRNDLMFDSRYNTYIYPGLPPGPIGNPGIDALRAVADPEQTGYFFFRALCDGSGRHAFAFTYEEHLENACP